MVNWALEQLTFESSWEALGAMTPAECADAMVDVLSTYYESVCDVPQVFPEFYFSLWCVGRVTVGNPLLWTAQASTDAGGYWLQSAPAVNDTIEFQCLLLAGTYTLTLVYNRFGGGCIADWNVNNSHVTDVLMMGTNLPNARKETAFFITTDGLQTITVKTKKGDGANDFANRVSWFHLRRTGA